MFSLFSTILRDSVMIFLLPLCVLVAYDYPRPTRRPVYTAVLPAFLSRRTANARLFIGFQPYPVLCHICRRASRGCSCLPRVTARAQQLYGLQYHAAYKLSRRWPATHRSFEVVAARRGFPGGGQRNDGSCTWRWRLYLLPRLEHHRLPPRGSHYRIEPATWLLLQATHSRHALNAGAVHGARGCRTCRRFNRTAIAAVRVFTVNRDADGTISLPFASTPYPSVYIPPFVGGQADHAALALTPRIGDAIYYLLHHRFFSTIALHDHY